MPLVIYGLGGVHTRYKHTDILHKVISTNQAPGLNYFAMSPFLKNLKIVTYTTRFLIRFTAWTKLAQAKLWVSHCIFNYSHHVYNSTFFVFSSANIQHCINNIGLCYFTVAPMWPKSYRTIGPKSTFLRHLMSHRTLSKH